MKHLDPESNPALQFLSTQTPEEVQAEEPEQVNTPLDRTNIPENYKIDYRYVEKRSKRLNLLITPSLHEALKTEATAQNTSINDLINNILTKAVKGE